MNRLLYALALGLVGAALVHVAMMLALPALAADRAWKHLASALPLEAPRRLEAAGLNVAPGDPLFRVVLCRFDLHGGPLLLTAAGRSAYWSAAVLMPDGRAVASVNSGMTGDEAPSLRILSQSQMNRSGADEAFPLVAEEGVALLALRVFVPDESWAPLADALLDSVACRTERRGQ